MVSIIVLSTALALASASQPNPSPQDVPSSGFRPDSKKDGLVKPPAPVKDNAILPEMRGDIYMARKMYREAIEMYQSMPETAITANKTGIAYHQLMQLDLAKKYYERSAKLNKHYPEALNNLGTVYYARKNYRRAVSQYEKALKISPDSASIWSNYGTAEWARKKYDEAMRCYQKAMALDPDVFEHHSATGVMLQERGVEERAKFHYYQAKLYAKQGMNDRALLYLRKALEEGLKDRDKINEEPDFAALRELPEFQELIAMKQRVL